MDKGKDKGRAKGKDKGNGPYNADTGKDKGKGKDPDKDNGAAANGKDKYDDWLGRFIHQREHDEWVALQGFDKGKGKDDDRLGRMCQRDTDYDTQVMSD
jgi:hypothetical protein